MKRSFLLPTLLAATLVAGAANTQTTFITLDDGSVQQYDAESVVFAADGSLLQLVTADGLLVQCNVDDIKALTFAQPAGSVPEVITAPEAVTFDDADADAPSQGEPVTLDDADDDFGDFVENFDPKGTITLTYNGNTVTKTGSVAGVNITIKGADVTVSATKKATYILKGQTDDGTFKLYSAKKCQVTLDGVTIRNADGPAIMMPKLVAGVTEYGGKTALIHLVGNSTIEDGTYVPDGDTKGTFFSEGQLIFSGNGSLNIVSHCGHGIACDDYVRLRGTSVDGKYAHHPVIAVTAAKDGISTNDQFLMYGGSLTINAADDGIDVAKGPVNLCGGTLSVTSVDEGITASYDEGLDATIHPDITVSGGFVSVTTTGDKGMAFKAVRNLTVSGGAIQAKVLGAGSKCFNADGSIVVSGGKATLLADGLPQWDDEEQDLSSAAGIRCTGTYTQSGGTIAAMATAAGGKGLNASGFITVSGGHLTLVTLGSTYTQSGRNSRARAINGDTSMVVRGGRTLVVAADECIHTTALVQTGGVLGTKSNQSGAR